MKFDLTSKNYYVDKSYTIDDCDYFYLYCLETEKSYLLKNENNKYNRGIYIRTEPTKNNQIKGINFSWDFEFDKLVNEL